MQKKYLGFLLVGGFGFMTSLYAKESCEFRAIHEALGDNGTLERELDGAGAKVTFKTCDVKSPEKVCGKASFPSPKQRNQKHGFLFELNKDGSFNKIWGGTGGPDEELHGYLGENDWPPFTESAYGSLKDIVNQQNHGVNLEALARMRIAYNTTDGGSVDVGEPKAVSTELPTDLYNQRRDIENELKDLYSKLYVYWKTKRTEVEGPDSIYNKIIKEGREKYKDSPLALVKSYQDYIEGAFKNKANPEKEAEYSKLKLKINQLKTQVAAHEGKVKMAQNNAMSDHVEHVKNLTASDFKNAATTAVPSYFVRNLLKAFPQDPSDRKAPTHAATVNSFFSNVGSLRRYLKCPFEDTKLELKDELKIETHMEESGA